MDTEYNSLLLRTMERCLYLKEGNLSSIVINTIKDVKKELQEWINVIEDGVKLFE